MTRSESASLAAFARWNRVPSRVEDRFWSQVDIGHKTECWEWEGRRNSKGYGQFSVWRKGSTAHRWAWRLIVGEPPIKMDVAHKCHNRLCVNPSHLYLATRSQNMLDAAKAGRLPLQIDPERTNLRKLTRAQVIYIRSSGKPFVTLAKELSISRETVSNVIKRRTWKHIP